MAQLSDEAKEARKQYRREWREKNKDKVNEYLRQWKKANPDKAEAAQARYWEKVAEKAKQSG